MTRRRAVPLVAMLLTACAAAPETVEQAEAFSRERNKLEDLAACIAQTEGAGESMLADPSVRAAVDQCMARLGYRPAADR